MLIKRADARRTEISGEEIGDVDLEDLIEEERWSSRSATRATSSGPRRAPTARNAAAARDQRRQADEEDPVEHLFVTSTHDYLLFFTNMGKSTGRRSTTCRPLARSKGRAVVNLLNLAEGREDRRLPRDPRLRPARPLPDDGHAQGAREEDRCSRRTAGR
jgi:DNA gyrase subunit A